MKTKDLQSGWVIGLMLLNLMIPAAGAQSQSSSSALPNAPAVAAASVASPAPPPLTVTEPYGSASDRSGLFSRKIAVSESLLGLYRDWNVPPPRLTNSSRIDTLYRDGKIYLSLDDAIMLALQNNFDIADRPLQPGHRRYGCFARQLRPGLSRRELRFGDRYPG